MVVGLFLASFVYPFPTFIIMLLYCAGRIWHQVGHTAQTLSQTTTVTPTLAGLNPDPCPNFPS